MVLGWVVLVGKKKKKQEKSGKQESWRDASGGSGCVVLIETVVTRQPVVWAKKV
jgi:hypothetical protein